ncbi:uncharacterized protein LOC142164825 [Nicotiana tabacum]|uniref:Uncharacterized protein LOC142164825 n=1 Tax=Nicotiana tabacum TaxID=4097 RepID=A0AC58S3V2_TOBAC
MPDIMLFPARMEAIASDSVIIGVSRDSLSSHVYMSTPVGDSIVVGRVYRSCLVILGSFETKADLLLLGMVDFDITLGMDWVSPYHTILDYHAKIVTLAMPGLPRIEWRGALDYVPSRVIPFLNAHRMVEKGCNAYLAFIRDVSVDTPTMESVLVVRDYLDVFLVDLMGMPPDKDVDFGIDLLSLVEQGHSEEQASIATH